MDATMEELGARARESIMRCKTILSFMTMTCQTIKILIKPTNERIKAVVVNPALATA